MLNREEILNRLRAGSIFLGTSWSEDSLRGAAYDLRMAPDFLIAPDGRRYRQGEKVARLLLNPGDVVLISTMERFFLPWNVVGNISIRFAFARKGLLIHTGGIIDPGYGQVADGHGGWTSEKDERIHFVIANVGDEQIPIRPGDRVAHVQFTEIDEPLKKTPHPGREKIEREYFSGESSKLSLAHFSRMKSMETQVSNLAQDIASIRRDVSSSTTGYQQVTYFGVYVLATALLTVFLTLLTGPDVSAALRDDPMFRWAFKASVIFALLFPVYLIWILRRHPEAARNPERQTGVRDLQKK